MQETLDTGYRAREAFAPFHRRTQRFCAIVAHRRAGKTVACIADLVDAGIRLDKTDGRFAYIAPFYNQAKDVAWNYLKRYSAPLLASPPNETELRVDLINGARIRLYGADNPDRLRGIYLDGVILDEYADMAPSIWGEVIRPLLSDRSGWATFIGTPKGRNQFYEIYNRASLDPVNWFSLMLRASETGLLNEAELSSARQDMTIEQYEQEFECSFTAAILGAYYGAEMAEAERAGRVTTVEALDGFPVHSVWDLGKGQNMPVWCFQNIAGQIRIVDFIQDYSFTIVRMCEELTARGYTGLDWVPHDAKAPDLSTGKTRVETMKAMKRKPSLVPDHKVGDGINAAKLVFPKVWFDAEKCRQGLEALRQYRADYDEKLKVFKDLPKHDWASHPADAFRYLAMAVREPVAEPPPKPEGKTIHNMSLNDAWKHLAPQRDTRI